MRLSHALSFDGVHANLADMEDGGASDDGGTAQYHIGREGGFLVKLFLVS